MSSGAFRTHFRGPAQRNLNVQSRQCSAARVLDRYLRWFVVTPDMHRVHHSIVVGETNSNFGFNLSWWDRLLGTYRAQPAAGHDGMTIGIEQFRDTRELWLDRMLLQPFHGAIGGYPITWRRAA